MRALLPLVWATALLGGCAIQEIKHDISTTQGRVDDKRRQLDQLNRAQAALTAERDELVVDLRTRELDAAQLRSRLETLRQLNDRAPTATPEERQRHDERARKLVDATNQAKVLEQDTTLSQQEKARRLAALKEKTRQMLNLLLAG